LAAYGFMRHHRLKSKNWWIWNSFYFSSPLCLWWVSTILAKGTNHTKQFILFSFF
jgi:hypothetical protein